MNHKLARKLMYVIILSGIVFAFVLTVIYPGKFKLAMSVGVAISSTGILIGVLFIRCPYCHTGLNLRGFSPDYCPNCGRKI